MPGDCLVPCSKPLGPGECEEATSATACGSSKSLAAIPTRFGKRFTARFGHVRSRSSFEDGRDLPVECRAMSVAFALASERKRSTAGMVFSQLLSDVVSHERQDPAGKAVSSPRPVGWLVGGA